MTYDLVLFGATSFVGQITTGHLAQRADEGLRWAIAGRSASKLATVAADNNLDVDQIVVDAGDDKTVLAMAQSTRLVISTVGPYAKYGSGLVAACATSGTDYCDLTGEPHWMAAMIDAHHDDAVESGARIVHACGFDSIPSDLGVWFLQRQATERFGEPAERVELIVKGMKGGASGGTIASMMNVMEELSADPSLRRTLTNPYALAPADHRSGIRQPSANGIRHHDDEGLWLAPFVMASTNTKVVHRTNALLGHPWGEFRYSEEMSAGSGPLGAAKAGAIAGGLGGFMGLVALPPTRKLLDRFVLPAPGEGPSAEQQRNGFFNILVRGETGSGKVIRVKVAGDRDPGYGSTAKMLAESAITLLATPADRTAGGFWTPATAMGDQLIEGLVANAGLTFEVLPSE